MPKQRKKAASKKHHVPDDQQDAMLIFISRLMNAMGLPSYRILIMEKPASKKSNAEIITTDDRYVAQLYLARDWTELPDETQRDTIVHEVLHLWHRPLSDWFRDDVNQAAPFHEYIRLERQFRNITELMVDHLAMILADTHLIKEEWEAAHRGDLERVDQVSEAPEVR